MSVYSGKTVTLPRPIEEIYAKVSDLAQYKPLVDQLPDEQRVKLQGVEFNGDSVKMDAPSIGQLVFRISERTAPTHVGFEAEGSPVPLKLSLDLASVSENSTSLTPKIDIEIPAMLRPFIGNKLQQAADHFGDMFTSLFQ
ncbi:MAG: hypothetical protein NC221_08095 [Duncaniella sp.]|nr:hypothetical protein [Muribaculum sp.]MCM1256066.1 hypothetical protein [Duncaniella sp.]